MLAKMFNGSISLKFLKALMFGTTLLYRERYELGKEVGKL